MRHEIVSVEAQESISAAGATMVDTSGPRLPDPDMEPRRADPEAIERLIDEIGAQSFPAKRPTCLGSSLGTSGRGRTGFGARKTVSRRSVTAA